MNWFGRGRKKKKKESALPEPPAADELQSSSKEVEWDEGQIYEDGPLIHAGEGDDKLSHYDNAETTIHGGVRGRLPHEVPPEQTRAELGNVVIASLPLGQEVRWREFYHRAREAQQGWRYSVDEVASDLVSRGLMSIRYSKKRHPMVTRVA